jgi:1-acyl-sn-glycerol-3-phosphate acyltransferase
MRILKWLAQMLYALYAFFIFMILTLIAFPLVMLSLLFGYHRGGNFIYAICKYWAATWFLLIGVRHEEIFEPPSY